MKMCSKCPVEKKANEFYGNVGLVCKECKKQDRREHYNKVKNSPDYRCRRRGENKRYRENNREKVNEIRREWHSKAMRDNPKYRVTVLLRKRIQSHIRAKKSGLRHKTGSPIDYLGCSVEKFVSHVESLFDAGMSWSNHGSAWELDHRIPLVAFDLSDKEDFQKACYYTNLQPLWVNEHKEKTRKEVLSYKGLPKRCVLPDNLPKDDAAGDGPETS